jgi:hypothetical protein
VTDPFPCDKNIFRPDNFTVASEDTDAAPVNQPALVNTNDQPSFSSVYFLLLTPAESLQTSDISRLPSLNLQSNTCGGTAKKKLNLPYRKFVGATQKKKIKQATKSKINLLASTALLGP